MEPIHINELSSILQIYFVWNKARINCMCQILMALVCDRTVNLAVLAQAFSGRAKVDSNYKRLHRFLVWLSTRLNYQKRLAKFILDHLDTPTFVLSLDRTNWKFRNENINILVLGIWYQGVSIPILWFCFNREGNSNVSEKIVIIQELLTQIPSSRIEFLLADREFVGAEWFSFLMKNNIQFAFRIKDCFTIKTFRRGFYRTTTIKQAFKNVKGKQRRSVKNCEIFKCTLSLSACISSDGDLVVVITNCDNPKKALRKYRMRWSIEVLFECLKGRGFNFEDTRIVDSDKIESLVFVLSLATFWAMKSGEFSIKTEGSLKLGTHGRPRKSIFRRGLELLRVNLKYPGERRVKLLEIMRLLVPKPSGKFVFLTG